MLYISGFIFFVLVTRKLRAKYNTYKLLVCSIQNYHVFFLPLHVVSVLNSFVSYKSFIYLVCFRTSQDRISNVIHSYVRIN